MRKALGVSRIKYEPIIISAIPINPKILGNSCKIIIPKIKPIIALYEFIGPNTDNSPLFKASTIKQLQIAPVNPPKSAEIIKLMFVIGIFAKNINGIENIQSIK